MVEAVTPKCSPTADDSSRYPRQSIVDKLTKLSDDLGGQLKRSALQSYRRGSTGDGGLDVVAWSRGLDQQQGNLIVFIQATTSPDGKASGTMSPVTSGAR